MQLISSACNGGVANVEINATIVEACFISSPFFDDGLSVFGKFRLGLEIFLDPRAELSNPLIKVCLMMARASEALFGLWGDGVMDEAPNFLEKSVERASFGCCDHLTSRAVCINCYPVNL